MKMRDWSAIGGSPSNDPAGISTLSVPAGWRGTRPPQIEKNWLVNRAASGTLKAQRAPGR